MSTKKCNPRVANEALIEHPRTRLYQTQDPLHIDHLAFPHILDLVLGFSDWSAQLKFRQTCKALRDRVDAQLVKHVVVRSLERYPYPSHGNERVYSFRFPSGRISGFPDLKESQLINLETSAEPGERWMCTILQHAETLDVDNIVPMYVRTVLNSIVRSPMVVRYDRSHNKGQGSERFDFYTAIHAPTIVLWPGLVVKFYDGRRAPCFLTMEIPEGPRAPRRVVIQHHFCRFHKLAHNRSYYVISSKGQPLQEIVVLFALPEGHPEAWGQHAAPNQFELHTMICGLAFSYHPETAVKLVGLDAAPPDELGFAADTEFETLKKKIAMSVRTHSTLTAWDSIKPGNVEETLQKIQYLTLNEYRAQIGEKQFALETEAPPAPPLPPK